MTIIKIGWTNYRWCGREHASDSRNFNEPAAAIFGGVLFAQSTQAPHEIQAFPAGVVIRGYHHARRVLVPESGARAAVEHGVGPPENPLLVGNTMTFTNACSVYANDGSR